MSVKAMVKVVKCSPETMEVDGKRALESMLEKIPASGSFKDHQVVVLTESLGLPVVQYSVIYDDGVK